MILPPFQMPLFLTALLVSAAVVVGLLIGGDGGNVLAITGGVIGPVGLYRCGALGVWWIRFVFGMNAHSVAHHNRELGIRLALGAEKGDGAAPAGRGPQRWPGGG